MISKFIKKLFGKKDELGESTREEKMFNLDLMMDKIFIYHESAYALIEGERYEEARNYISSELLIDPNCAEFAQGELNYINELLKRR